VAFTPDGRYAYATGYSSGIVSVINTARESVSAKIRVGDDAGAVAVSPDGRYVYLIDDDGIIVIDTGTNVVASTIYVGADGNVNGLTFSPDSDYAYIGGRGAVGQCDQDPRGHGSRGHRRQGRAECSGDQPER
jgi:YVTN family beta-propeller protein